jgi:hypothetical protein
MIWREKRVLLIILALLLAANTIFFFTYRVQYESRLQALDDRRDQARAQLQEAKRARVAAEQQYSAYRKIERDVQRIFTESWSTESERFTRLVTEVKRLAMAADLVPASTNYSKTESRPTGLKVAKDLGATEVGITFSVQGTYQQIRRLINMLELSDHFVIINSIQLSSAQGENLNLNLQIKTLFRDTSPPVRRVPSQQL